MTMDVVMKHLNDEHEPIYGQLIRTHYFWKKTRVWENNREIMHMNDVHEKKLIVPLNPHLSTEV